tara:strand:- start:5869 stop:6045 length:177 start_codon:yes stop_codon:yes gene_type:complete
MKNRTVKKYTVNTKNPNDEGRTYNVFTNLKEAREFGKDKLRANNFVSLLNFKRIPLAL